MENHLSLLEQLVNIDSGTGDQSGLRRVAGIISSLASDLSCNWETLKAADGSEHYYMHRGEGKLILLLAHLDTVFPPGTVAKRPFKIEGDYAYGPGVSDCKSGVVTILGALSRLAANWPKYQIGCLFNTDEEISSPGSREIIKRLAGSAAAVLVVEPAEGQNLTVARKGIGRFTLDVYGKAAHSGSNYQDGKSAILELAHKIIAIQALTDFSQEITLNVGEIKGGSRPNIIPDYATAEIDLRIKKAGQDQKVIAELNRIVSGSTIAGTTCKFSGSITRPPMELTAANLNLFNRFQVIGKKLGIELGKVESGGGSDANLAAETGVPSIDGLGPIGGGHHSESEYMVISSLQQRIDLLAEFLRTF
ncbi:MAG TPA: M20 family metallopeptidase [Bacillota bacterium]|nr:M20 family metallopeptidase [Bacillota bacterium]HOL10122.1 M20 family metallopeptidase [Bacillota bacterium]HPO97882.1 M20 family metallopeptidase [Bacillota bacterium]